MSHASDVALVNKGVSKIRSYFFKNENGATAVEYSLLVGLIAVFLIAAITTLGSSISETFREAACKVSGKTWTDGTGGANGTCV
jgi:pilus assembly protein Flp/PilA